MVKNVSDILEGIKIVYGDFDPAFADNIDHDQSVFIPYFPGIRAKLDINEHLQGKNIFRIDFWFKNFDNLSVELQIDDKTWDTHRPLYMNKIRQKGSSINSRRMKGCSKITFLVLVRKYFLKMMSLKDVKIIQMKYSRLIMNVMKPLFRVQLIKESRHIAQMSLIKECFLQPLFPFLQHTT